MCNQLVMALLEVVRDGGLVCDDSQSVSLFKAALVYQNSDKMGINWQ